MLSFKKHVSVDGNLYSFNLKNDIDILLLLLILLLLT